MSLRTAIVPQARPDPGLFGRLARAVYWLGSAAAALLLLGAVIAAINGAPGTPLAFSLLAVFLFVPARLIRYVVAGE